MLPLLHRRPLWGPGEDALQIGGCARQKVQSALGVSLHAAPRTPLGVQTAVTGVHPFAQGPPGGGSHTSIQVRGGLSRTADPPLRVTAGSHRPRPRLPGQSPCGTRGPRPADSNAAGPRCPRPLRSRRAGSSAGSGRRGRRDRLRRRRARPEHAHPLRVHPRPAPPAGPWARAAPPSRAADSDRAAGLAAGGRAWRAWRAVGALARCGGGGRGAGGPGARGRPHEQPALRLETAPARPPAARSARPEAGPGLRCRRSSDAPTDPFPGQSRVRADAATSQHLLGLGRTHLSDSISAPTQVSGLSMGHLPSGTHWVR